MLRAASAQLEALPLVRVVAASAPVLMTGFGLLALRRLDELLEPLLLCASERVLGTGEGAEPHKGVAAAEATRKGAETTTRRSEPRRLRHQAVQPTPEPSVEHATQGRHWPKPSEVVAQAGTAQPSELPEAAEAAEAARTAAAEARLLPERRE